MTKPVVTEHMIEEAVYAYHHEDTIDLQGMRRAITAAIAAMPPIKLPRPKPASEYTGYLCVDLEKVKHAIEEAGLKWSES
jgi:hypothetical protein